jgi:hypothetical protein
MKIIKPQTAPGWITVEIDGRRIEAKVYNTGSGYGINGGRVSKLAIMKKNHVRDRDANYFEQLDFNYDRGLDFDNLPAGVLDNIVAQLEALPVTDEVLFA